MTGPARVAVTGSTGLVGSALVDALRAEGRRVVRCVRREPAARDELRWDPVSGEIDRARLAECDALVHLAGENIAGGRWTAERKRRIRASRVDGTTGIARALAGCERPPRVLVSASAIGFYGDRGDTPVDEDSPPGSGFLAETCVAWESAASPAREAGVRVVHPRIGIVLSAAGGALERMLTPFKLGLGGRVGDGRQFMSWISRDDLVRVLLACLDDATLEGPVNAVAPAPVRNAELTTVLGRLLGRPTVFPLPAFVVRLLFGELGEQLLLAGARVAPARLARAGFEFAHPNVEAALRAALHDTRKVR